MHEASNTWGDVDQFFLKAAVRLAEEFDSWGGFGSQSAENIDYYARNIVAKS